MKLETPCIIIDENILQRNIASMARIAQNAKVKLRPHAKTHKIPEIAKMQIGQGAIGITVAKVSEAEVMSQNGIDNIFIAYPLVGEMKIERALVLNKKITLILGVDSLAQAKILAAKAKSDGQILEIRMEVDTGLRRTGVPYNEAIYLARELVKIDGLKLTGIYTFRGMVYNGKTTDDRKKAGLQEGKLMLDLAEMLRKEGIAIKDVSVGSTPTSEFAAQVNGVTEIRPGTYVFQDACQAKLGVCSLDDCAASILASVISIPTNDLAVIDGGSKTFATDVPPNTFPHNLEGFGVVQRDKNLILERLSEEHGMIKIKEGAGRLQVGQHLLIIPNHICPTINLHNKAYVIRDGKVSMKMEIKARGMVY